jgi:hypothetical protein
MKKTTLFLTLITSCILFGAANFCGTKNTSFKAGESITFKAYYHLGAMNAGAGEATFSTNIEKFNNKIVYHIIGAGKTYKSYDWFFKVRDKYETYIDTATMQPLKFVRDVKEGGYKTFNNVIFNHSLQQATSTRGVFKTDNCTQDVLSMIYFARNINYENLSAGEKIPFSMYIDDSLYHLNIKYLGKENIVIGDAKFKAVKFEPDLVQGTMFKADEKMTVWATADKNHIPLRIESEIAVGTIRVDVIDFKNLRHPIDSYLGRK